MSNQLTTGDNLVLIGFASCGKTTIGQRVAAQLNLDFCDLDRNIEAHFMETQGRALSCRQIYTTCGKDCFRDLESESLLRLTANRMVLATGGGAPLLVCNQARLKALGLILYLHAEPDALVERMQAKGLPAYLWDDPTGKNFLNCWCERHDIYTALAHGIIATTGKDIETITVEAATYYEQHNRNAIQSQHIR